MEEKNIKITINVECSEKSSVKKEQIAGYLLRAIAGVTANNKCLITNYVCEINEKNDDKLQEKYITGKPKLTKDGKIKYYWGMAARITLSGKKVKKIKQIYQA